RGGGGGGVGRGRGVGAWGGGRRGWPRGSEDLAAELPGEGVRASEELLEHEDPPQVTVERVLGGEADAGEHLLAVAGGHPRGPAGGRLRPTRPLRPLGPPPRAQPRGGRAPGGGGARQPGAGPPGS